MEKTRIEDKTVKDIFIGLLGEKNANTFLSNIQAQYDSGLRGKELENYAQDEIRKYHMADPGSVKLVFVVIGITVMSILRIKGQKAYLFKFHFHS